LDARRASRAGRDRATGHSQRIMFSPRPRRAEGSPWPQPGAENFIPGVLTPWPTRRHATYPPAALDARVSVGLYPLQKSWLAFSPRGSPGLDGQSHMPSYGRQVIMFAPRAAARGKRERSEHRKLDPCRQHPATLLDALCDRIDAK
jgi:hypothetical protein